MNEHVKHWRVVKLLLQECDLKLKGGAVQAAATSLAWFNSLDKILEQLEPKKEPPKEVLKKSTKKKV